ncbi:glycoside hydrolase family 76 protein [Xylanibacter brevis]|uniref:glycoside hydrolase family 76 protein n=1 Tax=Xylanibacter brevis TaxID=83231 RepID=UPI0004818F48|nr:glycoside hydrolase family 76 protein [Xylanibacter brevis]
MKKSFFSLILLAASTAAMGAIEVGKSYRIAPVADTSKSLMVSNASTSAGAPVVVWTETNVPAQQWTAEDAGDGKMAFRNVYTGMYLDATSASLTQVANQTGWTLTANAEQAGCYTLKQRLSLRLTNPTEGRQPIAGGTGTLWLLEEVQPQTTFDETARQRMLNGYLQQYMQDRGTGYRTFCAGGWGEAETLESILDCYEATGDSRVLDVFESCYNYLKQQVGSSWNKLVYKDDYKWYGHDFNDDVMWLIIAAARAHLLTGKTAYLADAKNNFNTIWNRAYLGYIGMLRWAENSGDRNGTNSCINGPAEVAACYIGMGTGDESYFEKARELYQNQRQYLFEPSTGKVWDSVVLDPNTLAVKSRNNWVSTYNQGTMLGAAILLYRHYGTEQYKQDADKIINRARVDLCNNEGIIHVCQSADGDFQGFKGILMRYAGLYAREFNNEDYQQWVLANAARAYNNMNSRSFGHSAWLTKASEDFMFGSGNDAVDYSLQGCAFGGAASLAAAFSVPVGKLQKTAISSDDAQREENRSMAFTYQAERAGHYMVKVYYRADGKTNVSLTVNDGSASSNSLASTGSTLGQRMLFATLKAGENTLTLSNSSNKLPAIEKIEVTYLSDVFNQLEAEHAVTTGQVTLSQSDDASGGMYARNIGNGSSNTITFKYDAAEAGDYYVDVTYFYSQNRQMYVRVNNGTKASTTYESTGSLDAAKAKVKRLQVTLKAGTNLLTFGNDNGGAPYIDKIQLTRVDDPAAIVPVVKSSQSQAWYSLTGVKYDAPVRPGLYIHGNKKVLVK